MLTGIPDAASDVAMTGEITLRGRVLPIGGLKEKLLAALRTGMKTVFIPKDNEKDLAEIPDNVKKGLTIIAVSHVDDVIGAGAGAARPRRSCGKNRPRCTAVLPVTEIGGGAAALRRGLLMQRLRKGRPWGRAFSCCRAPIGGFPSR